MLFTATTENYPQKIANIEQKKSMKHNKLDHKWHERRCNDFSGCISNEIHLIYFPPYFTDKL